VLDSFFVSSAVSSASLAGLSAMLTALASLGAILPGLPSVPSIIIWDQYVDLVEWSLNTLAEFFASGGVAIIAFTIIIKTALLPLTVKSIRSSKAMQDLQPRIKELQKKYGKDRQRLSQETMALYSTYGVNPMAGCLPMLLQIPIFFGLYVAIQSVSKSDALYWADGFMWLESLNEADPYKILPLMAGVFQFVQTRMMRPAGQGKISDPQQAVMNQMMNFMPLMVVIFGWNFASGPVLYWATQSVYSVVQQWFITGWGSLKDWLPWLPEMPEHRRLGYHPPRNLDDVVVVSGNAAVARPQRGIQGWLMKRMEAAQKQAAERQQATRAGRGQGRQNDVTGTPANATAPANTSADAAHDDIEETDAVEPAANRRGGSHASDTNPNRRSSSYQERVDAATKFNGRLVSEPLPADGEGSAANGVVQGTNGQASHSTSRTNGQTKARATRPPTVNAANRDGGRQTTPTRRPRKKRR
jgi:YidC/Oxa1 family membrane protein insertase